jgi:DNA-binding transcriptional ArsR family regulator
MSDLGARLMFQNPPFHLGADRMRVELDKKSLFALASDTRLEILHSLQPMRRTVSQLSESMNIDKAAVHRHLKKMEEGGLVKRYEDHGFVYYGLSWKARDLLAPNENTKIIILLSCSWLLIVALAFLLVAGFASHSSILVPKGAGHPSENYGVGGEKIALFKNEPAIVWMLPAVLLAACSAAIITMAVRRIKRPRQPANAASEQKEDVVRPIPED